MYKHTFEVDGKQEKMTVAEAHKAIGSGKDVKFNGSVCRQETGQTVSFWGRSWTTEVTGQSGPDAVRERSFMARTYLRADGQQCDEAIWKKSL